MCLLFLGELPDLQVYKNPLVRYEQGTLEVRNKRQNSFWYFLFHACKEMFEIEPSQAFYLLAIVGHAFFIFFFSTLSIEILFSILEKYFFRAKTCSPELELKFFLHFSFSRFYFVSSHLLAEKELVTHWHLFAMVVDIFSALWAFTFCCLFFKDAFFKKNLLSWSRIVIFFHLSFSSFDFFPNFSNVFKLAEWWTIKSMRYEPKRPDHTYLVLGCEDITVKC